MEEDIVLDKQAVIDNEADMAEEDSLVCDYYIVMAAHQEAVLNLSQIFTDDRDKLQLILEIIRINNGGSEKAVSAEETGVDLSSGKAEVGFSSTEKTEVVHLSPEKAELTHLSQQKTVVGCLSLQETDSSTQMDVGHDKSMEKTEDTHLSPQMTVVGCLSVDETDRSS